MLITSFLREPLQVLCGECFQVLTQQQCRPAILVVNQVDEQEIVGRSVLFQELVVDLFPQSRVVHTHRAANVQNGKSGLASEQGLGMPIPFRNNLVAIL